MPGMPSQGVMVLARTPGSSRSGSNLGPAHQEEALGNGMGEGEPQEDRPNPGEPSDRQVLEPPVAGEGIGPLGVAGPLAIDELGLGG